MAEMLEDLRKLQEVEIQLAEIRRNRESKERRVANRRRQVQKVEEKLQQNERNAREQQVRLDALQLEIASREESISHHRLALNKAKTNKEYASILAAMNTEKADNAKVEAAMLELMKEMETADSRNDEVKEESAKLQHDVTRAEDALAEFDRQSKGEKERLETERETFAAKIPPSALESFNRACNRHEGEAMAAVVKPRPKLDEYSCDGCNMKVTLEIVNALQNRDDIQVCGSCGRLLYFEAAQVSGKGR